MLQKVLDRIPYLGIHELRIDGRGGGGAVNVAMPLRPELGNHVGIFHAGAIFTLAETAAGVAAWQVIPGARSIVLLRGATIKYTRRAEGDVSARADTEPEQAEAARIAFDADGRADIDVEVTITDAGGETVFAGSFEYAIRPGSIQ